MPPLHPDSQSKFVQTDTNKKALSGERHDRTEKLSISTIYAAKKAQNLSWQIAIVQTLGPSIRD